MASAANSPHPSHLRTPIRPITQTHIASLITRPIPLTTGIRLVLRLHLAITRRPRRREETRTDIIGRPADAAIGPSLVLAVAARRLPNVQAERARRTGQAAEDACAASPFDCVRDGDLERRASFDSAGRGIAGDGGEERGEVSCHVRVEGVEGMGVGGFDEEDGCFLVGFAGGRINAGEPGLGFRAVADVAGVDIEASQVTFGFGEVVGGYMSEYHAFSIGWKGISDRALGKAEEASYNG